MEFKFAALWRSRGASVILAAAAISIGACSSPSWGISSAPSNETSNISHMRPLSKNPIAWVKWFTVNEPGAPPKANNKITGISDGQDIVGVYYTGTSSSSNSTSFVATPSTGASGFMGFKTFTPPPGASSLYLTSRIPSGKGGEAGYIMGTGGSSCTGFCGTIHMAGWTTITNPATGHCADTRLLGIGAARITVGYYIWGDNCLHAAPFEEYAVSTCCGSQVGSPQFAAFNPPGTYASAVATGMNGNGDAVGYTTDSSGNSTGWFYRFFSYYTIAYPGATSTQPLALAWDDNVVGLYVNSDGSVHGFLVQDPGGSNETYQPVYFNNGSQKYSYTVVASIDDCNDISGWYATNGALPFNGFVATTASAKTSTKCSIGSLLKSRKYSMKGGL